jgi:hypothetical protein
LTAVWIALDDATLENGCLWVIPGSHRSGVLHLVREQNDPRFGCYASKGTVDLMHSGMLGLPRRRAGVRDVTGKAQPYAARPRW